MKEKDKVLQALCDGLEAKIINLWRLTWNFVFTGTLRTVLK